MRRVGARIGDAAREPAASGCRRRCAPTSRIVGQSREMFLARTAARRRCSARVLPHAVLIPFALLGLRRRSRSRCGWSLIGAVVGALVPYARAAAAGRGERRRDFRHVVGAFLDLVAMNLAGGRGVPEALQAASDDQRRLGAWSGSATPSRPRGCRASRPWAALGQLGEEIDVDELRDLAAALALVADDGAKVRDSLTARAASMRRRELADAEGKAEERSQSMLVAQLLLCVGFLIFLDLSRPRPDRGLAGAPDEERLNSRQSKGQSRMSPEAQYLWIVVRGHLARVPERRAGRLRGRVGPHHRSR